MVVAARLAGSHTEGCGADPRASNLERAKMTVWEVWNSRAAPALNVYLEDGASAMSISSLAAFIAMSGA